MDKTEVAREALTAIARANFGDRAGFGSMVRQSADNVEALRYGVAGWFLRPLYVSPSLESNKPDGAGARLNVTCWPGNVLGQVWIHTVAKRGNQWGERQRYGRARIGGKLYSYRGQGAGMYARFRAIKGA